MVNIKWTAEQLQQHQDSFHDRVGFKPPAPRHAYDINQQEYIEGLSDDDLKSVGRLVYSETEGLVNGFPVVEKVELALQVIKQKHRVRSQEDYETHGQVLRDLNTFEDDFKNIEMLGRVILDGPGLAGDRKNNYQLMRRKVYRHYERITKIPKHYSGELRDNWITAVNEAAYCVLGYIGHSEDVYGLYRKLVDELERRKPKTPEEIAKEKAEHEAWLNQWDEDDEDPYDGKLGAEIQLDIVEDLLIEEQKKVVGYEAILEETQLILASKSTAEEKLAALELTLETNELYLLRSKKEIDERLAKPNVNQRYMSAVYKLNGISSIEGKTFVAAFKSHDQDGSKGNGHSKQMLALRTGMTVNYNSNEMLKFTVHRRRRNDGNDVDCEIHNGDERIQAILSLECDARDNFIVGTVKAYENRYWEQAEKNLLRKNYKEMREAVSWFASWHPKLKEEANRLIEMDKHELKKKGRG